MSPTMFAAIGRALERARATGNPARVVGSVQTIEGLRRRGWVRDVIQVAGGKSSGELTEAGRDAYHAQLTRDNHPVTSTAIAALRLLRDDPMAQDRIAPRPFGDVRRRKLITWDQDRQGYYLTEAGAEVLARADEVGDAT